MKRRRCLLLWYHHLVLVAICTANALLCSAQEHHLPLRSGTVDLRKLSLSVEPDGIFTAQQQQRRSLLAELDSVGGSTGAGTHTHHMHSAWGPLARHATYLLTLTASLQADTARQQQLLMHLEHSGGSVTSYLPPHTWVVSAGVQTAEWLAHVPDTLLALYPAHLKIAPEWLTLARKRGMSHVLQQLQAALQHDSMVTESSDSLEATTATTTQESASTEANTGTTAQEGTAAGRPGRPGSASGKGSNEVYVGEPRLHKPTSTAGTAGTDASSSRNASTQAQPPMFLIDVTFPTYSKADLGRVGLVRPHPSTAHQVHQACAVNGVCQAGNGSFWPALAAAADWAGPLQVVATQCGAEVVVAQGRVRVAACEEDLVAVLLWLAARPSVRWLSPHMEARTQNLRAGVIIQRGSLLSNENPTAAGMHPVWAAGIDGTGQILGIGDTGIDMDSCYFNDPAIPFTQSAIVRDKGISQVPAYIQPTHRKVVFYWAFGDIIDTSGHGTHTSGTLAGSVYGGDPLASPTTATGMAPSARLAFIDLSAASSGNDDGIYRPGSMDQDYYPWTYKYGARIHSDSWGSDVSAYDSSCAEVDQFVWDHQDFLPLFAAGNDSPYTLSNQPTIRTPALAKNAMAVAATWTSQPGTSSSSFTAWKIAINLPTPGGTAQASTTNTLMLQASFGASWSGLKGTPLTLAAAAPITACSGLNAAAVQGRVLVAERGGGCSFSDKLQIAQAAGAIGLIVTDDKNEGFFTMTGSTSATIPLGGVPLNTGRYLWAAANTGSVSATVVISDRGSLGQPYDQLTYFSSFGPAPDGRNKPDIVAPGYLTSAATDGQLTNPAQCSLDTAVMQGTSMATPVAAGAASLIRQYFTDGFYPTGVKTAANAYGNPSGALLRAVMVAGAAPLLNNIDSDNPEAGGMPVEPPPSVRQGWGRVDLSGSLPLPGNAKGWRLQVVDRANLTQGEVHNYCVSATGGPLRVVLVYHDWPGDPNAVSVLVNDLALEVRAAAYGGLRMLGNGWDDNVNNVETVLLDNLPAGNVSISVTAKTIFAKAAVQPYALAVLGAFSGVLQSPANPVGGSSMTTGSCVITLAVIDDAVSTSQPITGSNNLNFVFRTQSGVVAPSGFECKLTNGQGNVTQAPQHDWRPCTSPDSYNTVPDGTYVFMVRSTGESVADQRQIIVDTIPPATTIKSSVDLTPPNGASLKAVAAPSITFTFSAVDATTVTYTCLVSLTNNAGIQDTYFRAILPNNITVGQEGACTSPLTLMNLFYGDWKLTVFAKDAAGNVDVGGQLLAWSQRYTSATKYTRLASFPAALTNNPSLPFTIYAYQGTASGPPTSLDATAGGFQYVAWRGNGSAPGTWTAIPAGSAAFSVNAVPDGVWQVQARAAGSTGTVADTIASMNVTVDTTPPVIVISSRPDPLSSAAIASVKYGTNPPDDAVSYECRWLYSDSGPVDPATPSTGNSSFAACDGSSGMATMTVKNGWWLFQVRGIDAATNVGLPANVSFETDLDPPLITNIVYPAATTQRAVTISYNVADNVGGSGLANVSCTMKPTFRVSPPSPNLPPAPNATIYKQVTGALEVPCPNPARYSIVEGQYVFSLTAEDKVGLRTKVDLVITLDLQPPVTLVTTPIPAAGTAVPSQFTMRFSAVDYPKGGGYAGINHTDCMISIVPADQGPSLVTTPNTTTNGTTGRRRLAQSQQPSMTATGGAEVPVGWDTWQDAGLASAVVYKHFVSGYYSFKVRSIDQAGNQGNVSTAFVFRVDDTLPIDPNDGSNLNPSAGGGGVTLNKLAIGIIIAVGVLLVAGIVIAVVVSRRKAAARQRAAAAAAAAAPMPPPPYNPEQHHAHMMRAYEEERLARAIQASLEEDNLRKALEMSKMEASAPPLDPDEVRLQQAIRASLATSPPPTNDVSRGSQAIRASLATSPPPQ